MGILGAGMMAGNPIRFTDSGTRLATTILGKTGIETTRLGIGATRTQEPNIIRAAMDGGIRFLDTGRTYANGRNEEMIGEVIRDFRKEITIQSKVRISAELTEGKKNNETREKIIGDFVDKAIDESLHARHVPLTRPPRFLAFLLGRKPQTMHDHETHRAPHQYLLPPPLPYVQLEPYRSYLRLLCLVNVLPCQFRKVPEPLPLEPFLERKVYLAGLLALFVSQILLF